MDGRARADAPQEGRSLVWDGITWVAADLRFQVGPTFAHMPILVYPHFDEEA